MPGPPCGLSASRAPSAPRLAEAATPQADAPPSGPTLTLIVMAQEAPLDWLEEDGALSAAALADAHAAAAPWLDGGMYALLPYSCLLLTAVPAPPPHAAERAAPRAAAVDRCGPAEVLHRCEG